MSAGLILRYVIIAIIYIILFRIVRIMYLDLKGIRSDDERKDITYALEVIDVPGSIGIARGSLYPVHKLTSIGRKADNSITLNDPYVSSYHAQIYIENDGLFIKDLNSTNGTIKNGIRIKGVERLQSGDVIEIGRTSFKVVE
ncbi:FHA domain-containing protein [Fonticella tunisiensis]|uniref:FHA domain-containing protein n=1 Tax=Fonticella tunisiensis TaxID=1096341 RepID=A0A4R7KVZ2_9CLOT|nr:FHA domain-containing protein [Fonticella tunisiensis]TDT63721.1 FHA domain-containing protein [Fonticella tunisiensis]